MAEKEISNLQLNIKLSGDGNAIKKIKELDNLTQNLIKRCETLNRLKTSPIISLDASVEVRIGKVVNNLRTLTAKRWNIAVQVNDRDVIKPKTMSKANFKNVQNNKAQERQPNNPTNQSEEKPMFEPKKLVEDFVKLGSTMADKMGIFTKMGEGFTNARGAGGSISHSLVEGLKSGGRVFSGSGTPTGNIASRAMNFISNVKAKKPDGLFKSVQSATDIVGTSSAQGWSSKLLKSFKWADKVLKPLSWAQDIYEGVTSGNPVTGLAKAGGSIAGAEVGGTIGGAIGTVLLPGIGTVVGTVVGGWIGSSLGKGAVSKVIDVVGNTKAANTVTAPNAQAAGQGPIPVVLSGDNVVRVSNLPPTQVTQNFNISVANADLETFVKQVVNRAAQELKLIFQNTPERPFCGACH